ncbi:MAG: hypothetical protein K0S54_1425 [Alphaproteobacteria bacterium]|nr:hypothetical protein [Alphaproteobacteria bacterium]
MNSLVPHDRYARFTLIYFCCIGAFLILGIASVYALGRMGHLPPPPLTATSCIDEKFKFMREHADAEPDLLAIGSSVTWRNLDFSILAAVSDFRQPLNGAPCYLHVHETAWLTELYLDHFPSVRTVVTVMAMRDFESCQGDGQLFNATLGEGMMFEGWPEWLVYFVNFRPLRLWRTARNIKDMRAGADPDSTLVMDQFGSGPLTMTTPDPRDDVEVSPQCYPHLQRMAQSLERRHVRWVVVLMPPMPAWLDRYDPGGKRDAAWRARVAAALAAPNTVLIDASNGPLRTDQYFVDPAHYNWRYAASFTRWIFEQYASADAIAQGE